MNFDIYLSDEYENWFSMRPFTPLPECAVNEFGFFHSETNDESGG